MPSTWRVSPFGHVRINSRLRIPAPFRSLPRPSSLSRRNRSPYYPFSLIQTALFFYLSIFFPILSMNLKPGEYPRICLQYQTRRNPKRITVSDSSKKEVFQPHLPVRLPCYDLAPVIRFALDRSVQGPGTYSPRHG